MKGKIIILLTCLFYFGCKKDNDTQPGQEITCNNFDMTINDTLTTLVTAVTSSGTSILKIKNGTVTSLVGTSGEEYWGAKLSPDKKRFICFKSSSGNSIDYNDFETSELWMFNINGTGGKLITTRGIQGWRAMGMANWAPDGSHVVLSAEKLETDGNYHWNIYLTDTTGATGIKMNTRLGYFTYPNFANGDMTKITYSAWPSGSPGTTKYFAEVFYATVDGSYQITSETRLTNNLDHEYSLSFSSGNTSISYSQTTSNADYTPVRICTYNLGTSTEDKIIDDGTISDNPKWCTTNDMMYFSTTNNASCFTQINYATTGGSGNVVVYRRTNTSLVEVDIK